MRGRKQDFTKEEVDAVSIAAYKLRLEEASGPGAVARMIADDKDDGEKIAGRARAYNALTRAYMRVLADRWEPNA